MHTTFYNNSNNAYQSLLLKISYYNANTKIYIISYKAYCSTYMLEQTYLNQHGAPKNVVNNNASAYTFGIYNCSNNYNSFHLPI